MSGRRSSPSRAGRVVYDGATRILALAMIVLGGLLLVRGALLPILVGVALIGAGAGRLWILARVRRER